MISGTKISGVPTVPPVPLFEGGTGGTKIPSVRLYASRSGVRRSPGTAFYAGYNDNFNYNGVNPFTGNLENGFERNSRTFFIRASYLFRKSF